MKETSTIILADPGADKPLAEIACAQCVHCGCVWPIKNAGKLVAKVLGVDAAREVEANGRKTRGWCMNCHGPVCGPSCAECVPLDQRLDNEEAGVAANQRPIAVNVPSLWTP